MRALLGVMCNLFLVQPPCVACYPGYVAGATFAQALGWQGAEVNTSYAACASGSQALATLRAPKIARPRDVALVIGSDTTPKGFCKPRQVNAQKIRIGCVFV